MTRIPVRRALISVWDKEGIVELSARLVAAGVEIVSSGGTAAALRAAGVPVTKVEDVTGHPEILGGRVKTLHPKIHGGILADTRDSGHSADLQRTGIEPFDLVVVNLYPFEDTVASGADASEIIEMIDIGGPAMIRAAAKNHGRVGVVVDPGRYEEVAAAVEQGGLDDALRRVLALRAFETTAAYDAAIASWMASEDTLPERLTLPLERVAHLRYGENPDQRAAAYGVRGEGSWWKSMTQLQGKEMSFNNYLDTEAAWRLVGRFERPAVVIVKHANPCGVAVRPDAGKAFEAAWDCDPLSAFGGVVAINRPVDADLAAAIAAAGFIEVLIAPEVGDDAGAVLADKQNVRVLTAPHAEPAGLDFRRIEGGFVIQERDVPGPESRTVVSRRSPSEEELRDLEFAWIVAAHTKSNAIVVARDEAAIGVGAGDQSRVGATERAIARAGERSSGAVAASDAFLPFRDGLDTMASAGVTAVIEPGGSVRDEEVIAAADEHDIALVFTGRRHFLH